MTNTRTIKVALAEGASRLNNRLESQLLLAHTLGKTRAWLIAHDDDLLNSDQMKVYETNLDRRAEGEPVAYIMGYKEFWRHNFLVNQDVLVPRPETELIVEAVLERHPDEPLRIADLGTGSGAIAISLALENPEDTIIGIDSSSLAIQVARQNCERLGAHNVTLYTNHWLTNFDPLNLNVIVSNPPYIADNDQHLAELSFEPKNALVSGNDGLDDIRMILTQAQQHLIPDGYLVLEHGFDQQDRIRALMTNAGYANVTGYKDMAGQPRMVIGNKH